MFLYLLHRQGLARRDEIGAGPLAEALVGHRHDGGGDPGMAQEKALDLLGADLLAAAIDQVLQAALDHEAPLATESADGDQVPGAVEALAGSQGLQACYGETQVAPDDLLYLHWQGGGGYGDPLLREPELVAQDHAEGKVTSTGAEASYGVVLRDDTVDRAATEALRTRLREERRARSTAGAADGPSHAPSTGKRLDDNLVAVGVDGVEVVACAHCGRQLGDPRTDTVLALARFEGPTGNAGSQVTDDPGQYVDDEIVFRQLCCPGCYTAIYSGVVPAAHPQHVIDLDRYVQA